MYTKIVKQISKLSASQAGKKLKSLYDSKGKEYVEEILFELQNYNNDEWWLEMMYDAGEEVKNLY
jgi:hypothetical protein